MLRTFALLGLFLTACSNLPDIAENVCGNGILEAHEDCDNQTKLCVQCRLLCSDGDACATSGYLCGADGLCHAASGMFPSAPQATLPLPVNGFRVTDVDHDGYGDIVGLNPTAMTVRYGDSGAKLSRSYDLVTPQVLGNPTVAHFESDMIDDVVLPTADGLVAYTGAFGVPSPRQFPLGAGAQNPGGRPGPTDAFQLDDRIGAFSPTSFGSSVLGFAVMTLEDRGPAYDAATSSLCSQTIAATAHQDHAIYANANGAFVVFGPTDGSGTTSYQCVLWVHKKPAPIARSTNPSDPQCPAYPFASEQCEYDVTSLTNASFVPVTTRPLIADLDGDGCPSMYLASPLGTGSIVEYKGTDTDPSSTAVNCTMASAPVAAPFSLDEPAGSILITSVPLSPPAPVSLAHDPLLPEALVTAWGIYGITDGSGGSPTPVALYRSDRQLQRASVGDVDNDGAIDVVLSTSEPNLDIARRVPTAENFLLVRTPTTGGIVRSIFGDFDGDTHDDLAYVENLGGAQRLSIAYGTTNGLGPGVAADRFVSVGFMARMQVRDSTDPYKLVDDLIVIDFIEGQDNPPEITFLHGSPTRTMLSYYGTPVPLPDSAFVDVIAGDFVDGDSADYQDLFAIQMWSQVPGAILWVIPGLKNARLGNPIPDADNPVFLPVSDKIGDCGDPMKFCPFFAHLIGWPAVVDPLDKANSHDVVLGVDHHPEGHPVFMRIDPARPKEVSLVPGLFDMAHGGVGDMTQADIDGDGVPELVVAFNESAPDARDGHLFLCRMEQDGTPIECKDFASAVLGRPDLECLYALPGAFHPVCSIADTDDKGRPLKALAAVCRSYDPDPDFPDDRTKDVVASRLVPIRGVDAATAGDADKTLLKVIHASFTQAQMGDVTGDQVQDIIALDGSNGLPSVMTFRQEPAIETSVCYPDD